jgi:hypothetical protein
MHKKLSELEPGDKGVVVNIGGSISTRREEGGRKHLRRAGGFKE